jgi:signal transduction histidine kinase
VLADVRFESVERLTAAGIKVDWPVVDVGHHVLGGGERDALTAFLRETTSNVLRHAGATSVQVVTVCEQAPDGGRLHLRVRDDGRGLPDGLASVNDGIANLHARAAALGGVASVVSRTDRPGTEVNLQARLAPDVATS